MRFLAFLLFQLCLAEAAKYLVYNVKFSRSHTIYNNLIADTLAKHGHEMWNYEPIYTNDFNHTGTKLAKTIIRPLTFPVEFDQSLIQEFVWSKEKLEDILKVFTKGSKEFCEMSAKNCRDQLQDTEMIARLKAEKFDLFITEYFDPCGLVFAEKLGIKKHVGMCSMPIPDFARQMLGLPSSFSYVPDLYSSLTPKMTMSERAKNMLGSAFMWNVMVRPLFSTIEGVARDLVDPNFDFFKKAGNAELLFINTDELLDFARPLTHKVIYIGGLVGLAKEKAKKLPENLEKIFQEAKKGVVYMSYGTVAPSHKMPAEYKEAFLEAFSEFPDYTFLWKYEKPEDKITENYSNVIDMPWFPQRDLLKHPKLKLFITHAGQNSLTEASYSGQPILCVPLFADQFRNAQTAKWHGYGEMLDKTNLTKEAIVDGIRKILDNDNYRRKAKEMAKILSSKPISAEDLFVKNVEFATNFDLHPHLDMHGRYLSTIEYYNIDIFLLAFSVTVVVLYLFYRLIKLAVRCLLCRKAKKAKTE